MAGITGMACLTLNNAPAQDNETGNYGSGMSGIGGGNFDSAQFQQQLQQARMNNYRNQLEVADETQWAAIKDKIQKVLDAKQEPNALNPLVSELSGILGVFGRGQNSGNQGLLRGGSVDARAAGKARRNLTNLGIAPTPEEEALQNALDTKASNAEIKAAQTKVIESRKARQAKIDKAQEELRKALSTRQEAIALLNGLL
jgi:hypothetical protein